MKLAEEPAKNISDQAKESKHELCAIMVACELFMGKQASLTWRIQETKERSDKIHTEVARRYHQMIISSQNSDSASTSTADNPHTFRALGVCAQK